MTSFKELIDSGKFVDTPALKFKNILDRYAEIRSMIPNTQQSRGSAVKQKFDRFEQDFVFPLRKVMDKYRQATC